MTALRWTTVVLAAGLVLGGCGGMTDGGAPPTGGERGDARIQQVARGIFAATGLSDRMLEGAYSASDRQQGCADELAIPVDDAWSARRSYSVAARAGAPFDPEDAYDRAVRHLRDDGWSLREYEGPFGGAPAFRADQREGFVLYFGADGTFSVVVGPCSTGFPTLHEPEWRQVPRGRFTTPNPPPPPIRTPTARPSA